MSDMTPEEQLRVLLGDGYDAAVEKAARALFASEEPDRNDWRWDRPQPNRPNPFAWHAYWLNAAKLALGAALPGLLDAAAERDALRRRLVAVEMRVEDALRHGYDLDPQEIASALASALDATPGGE